MHQDLQSVLHSSGQAGITNCNTGHCLCFQYSLSSYMNYTDMNAARPHVYSQVFIFKCQFEIFAPC